MADINEAKALSAESVGAWLASCATAKGELLAADAAGKPAVSGAALAGDDGDDWAAADRRMKSARESGDADGSGLEEFKKSPKQACTTLLHMAQVAAGFQPQTPDVNGAAQFEKFLGRMVKCPFFFVALSDRQELHVKEKNWNEAIDFIVDLFEGVSGEKKKDLRKSIVNMTKAAGTKKETKNTDDLFVQNVLEASGSSVSVCIYYSTIKLEEDKAKGSTTRQSDIVLYRTILEFQTEKWPSYAEMVWEKDYRSVTDWMDDNTTTAGPLKVNLCIS